MWVLAGGTSFQYKKDSDQGGTRVVPLDLFHPCNPEYTMCLRGQGEMGSHGHTLIPARKMLWSQDTIPPSPCEWFFYY